MKTLSKKKKIIILVVMVALLAVTGYLNIALNNKVTQTSTVETVTNANFFATYRDDRQTVRQQEIACYDAIIASAESSAEAVAQAEEMRAQIVAAMEKELVVEGLIKAKGFEDVVVTTTTDNVNVVLKSGELTESELSQIVDIITQQTSAPFENIKIIPVA